MPSKKRASLSQEEIWDDSALIQSWDEALEEYQVLSTLRSDGGHLLTRYSKHYHSIHARGEKVQDVLQQAVRSSDTV